jgi:uncharacterized protein
MEAAPLPLFPLHTVLFPGGPLALRIFEPRYVDMVRRCMKEHSCFGVVTIFEGTEAGAVARLASLGTCARIVDFDPLPDGLLGITCVGGERVRILRRWQQPDGLHLAEVQVLPVATACELPPELAHLADLLREVLPKLGAGYVHVDAHFEDAGWVADRWAEILPLQPPDKLALLELDDPLERLNQVAAWSARQPPAAHV